MEIAVKCSCGSRYTFSEEPADGRLRHPVSCPNCGANGTEIANEYIRKSLSGELELERKKANVWWRRLLGRNQDEQETESTSSSSSDSDLPQEAGTVRLGLGTVGALAGGFIGMLIWYAICHFTGYEIGYVAWGVGVLAGLGARLFVPNGNFAMASVASLSAILAIVGGQYLSVKEIWDDGIKQAVAHSYEGSLAYAKEASKAETDHAIKQFMAKYTDRIEPITGGKPDGAEDAPKNHFLYHVGLSFYGMGPEDENSALNVLDEPPDVEAITDEAITAFKEKDLPELKGFAAGRPSKAEFEKMISDAVHANISLNDMLIQSWSPYQLLWIFLGVGSAYKLAYNRSETEDV